MESHASIHSFLDAQVKLRLDRGDSWLSICQEAIDLLSEEVYISFDIDGLSPDLCPHTGTPVPGASVFPKWRLCFILFQSRGKSGGF